jgi:predicted PurR-regulated permease PerM
VARQQSAYRTILTLATGALVLAVALPLWQPLLVAAVAAAAVIPWYDRATRALGGRRQLAGAVFVVALVVIVLLPVAWVVSVAVREAIEAVDFIRNTVQQGPEALLAHLPDRIAGLVRGAVDRASASVEQLATALAQRGLQTVALVGGALSATARALVQGVFFVVAFYFFLVGGRRLAGWLASISPDPEETADLAAELARTSRSVVASLFVTALVQAIAATIGYVIARVPNPVFFGLLTFLAAFIPSVGTAIIALPLAGLVLALGHPWAALFLALWAIVVVGLIDNVVKPLLIKGGVHLAGAVLFFALIGGLALFGAVGLLVGPLAVASFVAVVSRRRDQREAEDRAVYADRDGDEREAPPPS